MRANLRSRGDGPEQALSDAHAASKPPLTRRWTLVGQLRADTSCQTSAHAEMDPPRCPPPIFRTANLRSRGDGPAPRAGLYGLRDKPPLTRRWTRRGRPDGHHEQQTSAHAEMDRRFAGRQSGLRTNLRSRGDGPEKALDLCEKLIKPPLTRRWTPPVPYGVNGEPQTSAHAEMDLQKGGLTMSEQTNLRSRGDGPIDIVRHVKLAGKPPLTRRWTLSGSHWRRSRWQTSAHAEMDRWRKARNLPWLPNLRSRGDGPSQIIGTTENACKPPLTRRWTHRESDLSTVQVQTSAHAEMDPLSRLRCSLKATNLRSRGDGPGYWYGGG